MTQQSEERNQGFQREENRGFRWILMLGKNNYVEREQNEIKLKEEEEEFIEEQQQTTTKF